MGVERGSKREAVREEAEGLGTMGWVRQGVK